MDMIIPVKDIISDLYEEFLSVKTILSGNDRIFIQDNIDIIIQIVIIMSLQELVDNNVVKIDKVEKVLYMVKIMHIANIDMTIKKCFLCCSKKQNK